MEVERSIPTEVLDDLCSRFVINVPKEEQKDLIRILFQIESAHWFYIDFYSKQFPGRKACGLREFTLQIFKHIPFLQPFVKKVDVVIEDWKGYKFCVPTFGAILLDEDLSHVLLVKSFRSAWGFPKGKVNKGEPPYQCAIREVGEETGFDISNLIDANDYIEATVNSQNIRLYIIPGVQKSEKFVPQTRNEIKDIRWFPICDIPLNKKDALQKQMKTGYGAYVNYNSFYMVSPFLRKLRQWIYENNSKLPQQKRRPRHKSCSDIDYYQYKEPEDIMNIKCGDKTTNNGEQGNDRKKRSRTSESNNANAGISLIKCLVNAQKEKGAKLPPLPKAFNYVKPLEEVEKSIITQILKISGHPETADVQSGCEENDSSNSSLDLKEFEYNTSNAQGPLKGNSTLNESFVEKIGLPTSVKSPFVAQMAWDNLPNANTFKTIERCKIIKRKRGKKNGSKLSQKSEQMSSNEDIDKTQFSQNELIKEHDKVTEDAKVLDNNVILEGIPHWLNFKFNINSILKSMNEAVLCKQINTKEFEVVRDENE